MSIGQFVHRALKLRDAVLNSAWKTDADSDERRAICTTWSPREVEDVTRTPLAVAMQEAERRGIAGVVAPRLEELQRATDRLVEYFVHEAPRGEWHGGDAHVMAVNDACVRLAPYLKHTGKSEEGGIATLPDGCTRTHARIIAHLSDVWPTPVKIADLTAAVGGNLKDNGKAARQLVTLGVLAQHGGGRSGFKLAAEFRHLGPVAKRLAAE